MSTPRSGPPQGGFSFARNTHVLFVHGTDDRVATLQRAEVVATRMAARGRVGFITVPGGKHAMLRHGRAFEQAAAEFVATTLLGADAAP